jgi:hypothetical protein
MTRTTLGLGLVLLSALAWAGGPPPAAEPKGPEKVVSLADFGAIRNAGCSVTGPAPAVTCDRAFEWIAGPIVLREVQLHSPPSSDRTDVQCWARVLVSEDGSSFTEIAKFSWAAGDRRSFNHVLPVPIGLSVSEQSVFRLILGVITEDVVECKAEVKAYVTMR